MLAGTALKKIFLSTTAPINPISMGRFFKFPTGDAPTPDALPRLLRLGRPLYLHTVPSRGAL